MNKKYEAREFFTLPCSKNKRAFRQHRMTRLTELKFIRLSVLAFLKLKYIVDFIVLVFLFCNIVISKKRCMKTF